jgi:hypothetical protein
MRCLCVLCVRGSIDSHSEKLRASRRGRLPPPIESPRLECTEAAAGNVM